MSRPLRYTIKRVAGHLPQLVQADLYQLSHAIITSGGQISTDDGAKRLDEAGCVDPSAIFILGEELELFSYDEATDHFFIVQKAFESATSDLSEYISSLATSLSPPTQSQLISLATALMDKGGWCHFGNLSLEYPDFATKGMRLLGQSVGLFGWTPHGQILSFVPTCPFYVQPPRAGMRGRQMSSSQQLEMLMSQRAGSKYLQADKEGIIINQPASPSMLVNGRKQLRLTVRLEVAHPKPVSMHGASLLQSDPQVQLLGSAPTFIRPGEERFVCLDIHATREGAISLIILFSFEGFVISRPFKINVHASEQSKAEFIALVPDEEYSPQRRQEAIQVSQQIENLERIPVAKVEAASVAEPAPTRVHIPNFKIPPRMRDEYIAAAAAQKPEPQLHVQVLNDRTYCDTFRELLYAEELQEEWDLRAYAQQNVALQRSGGGSFFWLDVPGLAEKRPSVVRNDLILIAPMEGRKCFEGQVDDTQELRVLLKMPPSFSKQHSPASRYSVSFTYRRMPMRRRHFAVLEAAEKLKRLLFPKPSPTDVRIPHSQIKLQLFNGLISTNPRQQDAVNVILSLRPDVERPPFIVYGPAGTGKTMVLAEAVLQIIRASSTSRVLVCCPSNSACDVFLERLIKGAHLSEKQVLRLNAFQRPLLSVPLALVKYCNGRGPFESPSRDALKSYQVVVSTCINSASIIESAQGLFTHIFVDEAGQANEPEALIPIALLSTANTRVVLAGDPKQLGPVTRSKQALRFGLGHSLVERLLDSPIYRRDTDRFPEEGYNPMYVVKLLNNYRSHESIIAVPNKLFYEEELVVNAPPEVRNSMMAWCKKQGGFAVTFHGVNGKDMREASSPSWFNPDEVIVVANYVNQLMHEFSVKPEDIGIITPYLRQIQKIRTTLKKRGITSVKVDSVESFQGQERRCIIISTVRASDELLAFDQKHNLGFLTSAKRFNVAVTRAQALLIVVGCPSVLASDSSWSELLWHAVSNKAYVGVALPPRDKEAQSKIAAVIDEELGLLGVRPEDLVERKHAAGSADM